MSQQQTIFNVRIFFFVFCKDKMAPDEENKNKYILIFRRIFMLV